MPWSTEPGWNKCNNLPDTPTSARRRCTTNQRKPTPKMQRGTFRFDDVLGSFSSLDFSEKLLQWGDVSAEGHDQNVVIDEDLSVRSQWLQGAKNIFEVRPLVDAKRGRRRQCE